MEKEEEAFTCWICKGDGHKAGSRACPMFLSETVKRERLRWSHEDPMHDFMKEEEKRYKEKRVKELQSLLDTSSSSEDEPEKDRRKRKKKRKKTGKKKRKRDTSNDRFSDLNKELKIDKEKLPYKDAKGRKSDWKHKKKHPHKHKHELLEEDEDKHHRKVARRK